MFPACIYLIKLAVVVSYLKIFTGKLDRFCIYSNIVFLPWIGLILALLMAFQCSPVNAFWDMTMPRDKCLAGQPVYMVAAGIDVATNIVVFMWPIRALLVPVTARLETSDLISRLVLGSM